LISYKNFTSIPMQMHIGILSCTDPTPEHNAVPSHSRALSSDG